MHVRGLIVEWVPRPRRHHTASVSVVDMRTPPVSGNKHADDIEVRSTARFLEL